jgi:hypothetical protein
MGFGDGQGDFLLIDREPSPGGLAAAFTGVADVVRLMGIKAEYVPKAPIGRPPRRFQLKKNADGLVLWKS